MQRLDLPAPFDQARDQVVGVFLGQNGGGGQMQHRQVHRQRPPGLQQRGPLPARRQLRIADMRAADIDRRIKAIDLGMQQGGPGPCRRSGSAGWPCVSGNA
ncbi:hypothetical protein [Paracoccus sp. (in: a-proteobacteria)]|uniref:hypothetical protein n=1 Tax=Paracoccus sp. TaxID=267 RepID=UPI0035B13358